MVTKENNVDIADHKSEENKRRSRHMLEKSGGKEEKRVGMSERI